MRIRGSVVTFLVIFRLYVINIYFLTIMYIKWQEKQMKKMSLLFPTAQETHLDKPMELIIIRIPEFCLEFIWIKLLWLVPISLILYGIKQ